MPSQSRSDASRANGAKSRGPITPRGKAIVSRNSLRHGFAASMNVHVLPGEQREQFQLLLDQIVHEHKPESEGEKMMAEAMAVAKWRQMRAWEVGDATFAKEIRDQESTKPELAGDCPATRAGAAFRELADRSQFLVAVNRYEARYERLYERCENKFRRIRAAAQMAAANIKITEQSQQVAYYQQNAAKPSEDNPGGTTVETLLPDVSTARPSPAQPGTTPTETTPAAPGSVDPSASPDPKPADCG